MNSLKERLEFSSRLQQALRDAEYPPDSPTWLAREFNQHFSGHPVTVHAARKWLQGESIPTQDKLRALAGWLDVPAEWLRFGNAEARKGEQEPPSSGDAKLLAQLQQLDEPQKTILRELLRVLLKTSKKK